MYDHQIIGRHKSEIETPALILDMGAAERNIAKMAEFFQGKACQLRPHIKTHKLPLLAHKQIDAGAIGITCAKIGEADLFLQSGIKSVLIANEIVTEAKIKRMVNLAKYGELIVCVDDFENASNISDAAGAAGVKMNVLVEINAGINRCGVAPGIPTLEFVRRVSSLKNICFRGLIGYEGGLFIDDPDEKDRVCRESNARLVDSADLVRADGFPVEIVTAGGSNTCRKTGTHPGITDIQVGSYVTMDTHNRKYGLDFEQAISIMATVISRPEQGRAVTDAGKKALSVDAGLPEVVNAGVVLFNLNEEHGHVRIEDIESKVRVGDTLEIIPSHGCTTIPLYDRYYVVRNDHVESIAEIHCRQTS